jgi:hypothetical protein
MSHQCFPVEKKVCMNGGPEFGQKKERKGTIALSANPRKTFSVV